MRVSHPIFNNPVVLSTILEHLPLISCISLLRLFPSKYINGYQLTIQRLHWYLSKVLPQNAVQTLLSDSTFAFTGVFLMGVLMGVPLDIYIELVSHDVSAGHLSIIYNLDIDLEEYNTPFEYSKQDYYIGPCMLRAKELHQDTTYKSHLDTFSCHFTKVYFNLETGLYIMDASSILDKSSRCNRDTMYINKRAKHY